MNSWQAILHNTYAVPALCDPRESDSSLTTTGTEKSTADYINGSRRLEKTQHRSRRRQRGRRRRRTIPRGVPPPLTLVASPSTQRSFWQRYSRLRASKSRHIQNNSSSNSSCCRKSRAATAARTSRPTAQPARSPKAPEAIAVTPRTPFCYTAAV